MRHSGILLNITSLPSSYGMGSFADADKFIQFLSRATQKYWQVLPITQVDADFDPYNSLSAYAGNVLLIDTDALVLDGLLTHDDLIDMKSAKGSDFPYAATNKIKLLSKASFNFYRENPTEDFVRFCELNAFWLDDYALFISLYNHFDGKPWWLWDDPIARYSTNAVMEYTDKHADNIDFVKFCQYLFYNQWTVLRDKLMDANINLIGEMPFFVSYNSADVWAHRDLFELTSDVVYNWPEMRKTGFDWWIKRIKHNQLLFDKLYIKDINGFEGYYELKSNRKQARLNQWKCRDCQKLVDLINLTCADISIVTDTKQSLFNGGSVLTYLNGADTCWESIETLLSSNAETTIVPMRIIAGIDETNTNKTSEKDNALYYMANAGDFSSANAKRLQQITIGSNRL